MSNYLIIGGGISGVLMGRLLNARGLTFQGLEKSKQIGKDFGFGQLRFHLDKSVGVLKDICETIDWTKVDEQPRERKKGDWVTPNSEFIDEEKSFLGNPFYRPNATSDIVVDEIRKNIQQYFATEKAVEKIDLEKRVACCQDGSEFQFDQIFWCADLKSLTKVVQGSPKTALKSPKKKEDAQGGIHLEMELKQQSVPGSNSIIFPFRYKDYKLRAIGINDLNLGKNEQSLKMHWLVFVERELAEDREEVAKVIRALKRELLKEFPELKTAIIRERIVFQPRVDAHTPSEAKALELYPGVFYVGPEVHLADSPLDASPWDLIVENCKRVEETLHRS